MRNTTFAGNIGEQIAADYLESKGYRIIERNAKICGAEIDIICEAYLKPDGTVVPAKKKFNGLFSKLRTDRSTAIDEAERTLIFCEVKTRGGSEYGSGADAVTPYKMGRYVTAAKAYTASLENVNANFRFDVIEIGANGIKHLAGAFCENDARYSRR